jgi:hypothetical protein
MAKGSSSIWAACGLNFAGFGLPFDDFGPNCAFDGGDDIATGRQLRTEYGVQRLLAARMPVVADDLPGIQQTARSMHRDGVFASKADGSVRWISNAIESLPSAEGNLSAWDRLLCSQDGFATDQ